MLKFHNSRYTNSGDISVEKGIKYSFMDSMEFTMLHTIKAVIGWCTLIDSVICIIDTHEYRLASCYTHRMSVENRSALIFKMCTKTVYTYNSV